MSALLDQIRRHALQQPDAIALAGQCESVSYSELWQQVTELASDLNARGVERAGLAGENSTGWVIADLACVLAGVVCVPIPTFFSASQRRHLMDAAGLDAVLTTRNPSDASYDKNDSGHTESLGDRLHLFSLAVSDPRPVIPAGTAKITFTSGSTGTPKGVCLSQKQLERTVQALDERLMGVALQKHLCLLPLATLLENVAGVYLSLLRGASVVILPGQLLGLSGSSGLDPLRMAQTLNQWQPQSLILVPELGQALVRLADRGLLHTEHYRFLAVGGARVAPALLDQAQRLGLPMYEGYGLSECGSVVALNVPGSALPGSCGQPLSHVAVTVAADGHVQVGGNRFLGYLGESPQPDGEQLDTGDLGRLDAGGYLHINGRAKNLIITGFGRNISPEWLESELLQGLGALQVLVFGDGDTQPSALVFAMPEQSDTDLSQRLSRLNTSLPDYARVATLYRMPAPLSVANGQLTANGRLRRGLILEQLEILKDTSRRLCDNAASACASFQSESSQKNEGVSHGIF